MKLTVNRNVAGKNETLYYSKVEKFEVNPLAGHLAMLILHYEDGKTALVEAGYVKVEED